MPAVDPTKISAVPPRSWAGSCFPVDRCGGVSLGGTVRDLAQDGKTMFLAAQEMQFARGMSDMVAFLNKRTVLKTGPSEQVFGTPAETRTQESLMQIMEAGQ